MGSSSPLSKVLEKKTANWSRAEGLALMENWLTAHPNEIKGVIGENDEMALGAIQAIKGRGLNVKDFVVVGIDGVPDAINAVKAGEMFSILQDAEGQAAGALDVALPGKTRRILSTKGGCLETMREGNAVERRKGESLFHSLDGNHRRERR
jgi:ABC-type sugar transport system substrate-binding protein